MDSPDWYLVLDVRPDAGADEIKAAHRRRARELHPDISAAPDATARMAELNRARDVLLDPRQRAAFDHAREAASPRRRGFGGIGSFASARARTNPPAAAGGERTRFTFTRGAGAAAQRHEDAAGEEAAAREASRRTAEARRWRFDPRRGPAGEDWYAFLGVQPWATSTEIQAAVRGLAGQAGDPTLSPEELRSRQAKLAMAWETLGVAAVREAYDTRRPEWTPAPGPLRDWYELLGLARGASREAVGEAVTRLSRETGTRLWNADLRERDARLREAWWTLRDPARRAAYDAALERNR